MAAKLDLAPLPLFDPLHEPSLLSQSWKSWTKRFKMYVAAMNITDDKRKRALLLYQAGLETQEIFKTLTDAGGEFLSDAPFCGLSLWTELKVANCAC